MHELGAIHDLAGRAGSYAMLSFSLDTTRSRARRAHPEGAGARRGDRDPAPLLRPRVERACRTSGPTSCSPTPSSASAAHHLRNLRRYRPHQLSEPEERVLTETNVTGGSAFQRLFTEQTSALEVPLPDRDEPALARGGPVAAPGPRPRARAARPPRRSPPRSAPGLRTRAFVFNTLLAGQGDEGPPARLPALARVAQPGQRGERRVGRGADRRGAGPLRPGAALVLAEGAPARARPARRPTTGWRRCPTRTTASPTARPRRSCSTATAPSRPSWAPRPAEFFTGGYMDGPPRPGKRGGAFCSYTVPSRAPVRDAQLHLAPARRAHDGPRAGPRRARRARAPAGHLPLHHPADARRDRLDLRREHRARAAARARARRRRAARPAGRRARRRRGRGVPPDRDEPLRGRDPHRAPRARRAVRGALRRAVARHAGRPARRHASSSTTTTASGGPTSGTSSTRRATSTPTRTATCSRCRCTGATRRRARASWSPTSTCSAPAARGRPRSSGRSWAWTSPTPASGAPGSS